MGGPVALIRPPGCAVTEIWGADMNDVGTWDGILGNNGADSHDPTPMDDAGGNASDGIGTGR